MVHGYLRFGIGPYRIDLFMLTDLSIRDVVLIERLDLNFDPGLAVLTGETGAGKSILLDALGLALGARAEARLVRHGRDQASVSAGFSIDADHPAYKLLADHGLECDEHLLLRRILGKDGRSRAYANDQPISITLLRQLGELLVEIQGQFDQHGLMDASTHIDVLDNFSQHHKERQKVMKTYHEWQRLVFALQAAIDKSEKAKTDEEYLRFALDELEKFGPSLDEEEELSKSRILLQNAEKLVESINDASNQLSGSKGADAQMRQAQRILERAGEKTGDILDTALASLDRAAEELQEAIAHLNTLGHEVRVDDARLNDVEERLFALRDLARKHDVHPNALTQVMTQMTSDLQSIQNADEEIATLRNQLTQAHGAYSDAAHNLSEKRQVAARKLDKAVNSELAPLKLERAVFTTNVLQLSEAQWNANGIDNVTFQVATNPGTPAGPLGKIASGGELSRFLLALKVSLAETGATQTLVFDEVDSGVGGATAAAVGERLSKLAENVQVLVVTHSPQVAARGRDHWNVRKELVGDSMITGITRLNIGERQEELARMLSGAEITDEARSAAAKLMESNGR